MEESKNRKSLFVKIFQTVGFLIQLKNKNKENIKIYVFVSLIYLNF